MNKLLTICPVCNDALRISEVQCEKCGTQIRSHFASCRFCSLTPEQTRLIEIFLSHRGNISGLAAELGLSHPTAARRLNNVLYALGLLTPEKETSEKEG